MPVVSRVVSDLITDPRFDQVPPDPARAKGRPYKTCGTVANGASDSATSTYILARIPADCILKDDTWFSTAGWGFATVQVGVVGNPTGLINAAKATVMTPIARGDAKHGLPAWQQLGLSSPPTNNVLEIIATGPANATGAGTMLFELAYTYHS